MWLNRGIGERREWFQPNKRKRHKEGGEGMRRISKAIMIGSWKEKIHGDPKQNGGGTCAMKMGFRGTAVK